MKVVHAGVVSPHYIWQKPWLGKVLSDFPSDSELGLHHSLLKPKSLQAETGDKKKR